MRNMKRVAIMLCALFVLAILISTPYISNVQPTPPVTTSPNTIQSQKTYSSNSQNWTWQQAWRGPENDPLPDYASVPYRNVIKNPSFMDLTQWTYSGTAGYSTTLWMGNWYGGSSLELVCPAGAGTWCRATQYVQLVGNEGTIFMGAFYMNNVPAAGEYLQIDLNYQGIDGIQDQVEYIVRNAVLGAGEILIGTAGGVWIPIIRNVTADALYLGVTPPDFFFSVVLTRTSSANSWAAIDSLYLGNDVVMATGSHYIPNIDFEYPVRRGANSTAYAPTAWTGYGLNPAGGEFRDNSVPAMGGGIPAYMHFWNWNMWAAGAAGNFKSIAVAVGINPPMYIAWSHIDTGSIGNNLPASVEIMDLTANKVLYYESGQGAAAIRGEVAGFRQIIHAQETLNVWYYHIKDWQTDWANAAQFGVAPNMADSWRISLNQTNIGGGVGVPGGQWDSVWMGSYSASGGLDTHPFFNAFMFSDLRNPAYLGTMAGLTPGFTVSGFDFDGLFCQKSIGASAYAQMQLTFYVGWNTYDTRRVKIGLGPWQLLSYTAAAPANPRPYIDLQINNCSYNAGAPGWFLNPVSHQAYIWINGQTYYPQGSTITLTETSAQNEYERLVVDFYTGVGDALNARIVLKWMSVEDLASDTDVTISYYSLDGWGVDYWFVKTFVNGTRQPNAQFTLTNSMGSVLNITIDDYFDNKLYTTWYTVTSTTTILDLQLQLVQVSMQSVGLTTCMITQLGGGGLSKNITFYNSGQTLLYATAGGITYRFHGMAAISSNALIPLGTPYDVTTVITTAQSRTVVLMTTDILQQILQGIIDAKSDLGLIKDTQGTTITAILGKIGENLITIMVGVMFAAIMILAGVYGTRRKRNPYDETELKGDSEYARLQRQQNARLLEQQRKQKRKK